MFLTLALLAKKAKAKHIMVEMVSLVSGHKTFAVRERLGDKLEYIRFDPRIQQDSVYKEAGKIKSMKPKYKPYDYPNPRPISRFQIQ
ncbi:39S ribosomal protein L33, mitochondrial-like [Macrosteles quadrilineatus]|uniref:39S ribosomal protein L33, mitochondrial-like n=1 Tax=Macrosteles quadrilineatus TaxID=74068 RepID=UPI0023E2879A|nr:39S ribosomal protein L33, mitochondrial-like [Macrosteles quadrilineatus]XP_054269127.1 39S ribosomal protein L33, mitochondrial-like [Macrosteles quadrilineatus]